MTVSAVTQGTLGGCCFCWAGIVEGAAETAGEGLGLEEAVSKLGRKGPLPQGRCLYWRSNTGASSYLSQALSSWH